MSHLDVRKSQKLGGGSTAIDSATTATDTTIVNFAGIEKSERIERRTAQNWKAELLRPAHRNLQLRNVRLALDAYDSEQRLRHAEPWRRRRTLKRHDREILRARIRDCCETLSPSPEQSTVIVSSNHGMRSVRTRTGTTNGRRGRQRAAPHRAMAQSREPTRFAGSAKFQIAEPAASKTPWHSPLLNCRSATPSPRWRWFPISAQRVCASPKLPAPTQQRRPPLPKAIETRLRYRRDDDRAHCHFRSCGRFHFRSRRGRSHHFRFCDARCYVRARCHVRFRSHSFSSPRPRAPPQLVRTTRAKTSGCRNRQRIVIMET